MSERGVFAVDRGIFNDPDFANEPFTEREAFMWLVSEAAWRDHRKRADGKIVEVKRGQLCHSVRFMAEAWQWSKSRVQRFLDRLENRDTISRDHGTRTPTITICKYDHFQRVSLPDRDNSGTIPGTSVGQQRDKLEDRESKEDISSSLRSEEARVPSRRKSDQADIEEFRAVVGVVLDRDRLDAICKVRRKKGAVFSAHAGRLLVSALRACPDPLAAADEMVLRNWTGVKPEWLSGRQSQAPPAKPRSITDVLKSQVLEMQANGRETEEGYGTGEADGFGQALLGVAGSSR